MTTLAVIGVGRLVSSDFQGQQVNLPEGNCRLESSDYIWVWVNTYRYILVGRTSIYQLFWGSLGTRVLTLVKLGGETQCIPGSPGRAEILETTHSCAGCGRESGGSVPGAAQGADGNAHSWNNTRFS